MSKGYDDFFKAARQSKGASPEFKIQKPKTQASSHRTAPPTAKETSRANAHKKAAVEADLRQRLNMKTKKSSKFPPFRAAAILSVMCAALGFGYAQPEAVESWLSKVEILPMGSASAADETGSKPASGTAEKSGANGAGAEKSAESGSKDKSVACIEPSEMSEEDLSHFKRLSDRKKELDLREQELNALEEELHKQREEVETRIVKLDSIRGDISNVLKDRVEVDEERVKTLVEFYSNMKPKQAADIVATLNEDLAVEVLGKMKKKNAAEIMNLLPPEKARTISEKFTGYKRR